MKYRKHKEILTKEFLHQELIVKNKRAPQISKETGIPVPSIYRYAKSYNIYIPNLTERSLTDYRNKRFGRLMVSGDGEFIRDKKALKHKCICDCGNIVYIRINSLKQESTTSCGCYRKELDLKDCYKDISAKYFYRLKECAKNRNIDFNIKIEDIWNQYLKQNKKCYFSNLDIFFIPNSSKLSTQTASVDRINPKLPYNIDNIVIVHKRINVMKHNMTNEEFEYWIYQIFNHIQPNGKFNGKFAKTSYNDKS